VEIKLKLSSGKKVEFTPEEFKELVEMLQKSYPEKYNQYPVYPVYPAYPDWTYRPYHQPVWICGTGTTSGSLGNNTTNYTNVVGASSDNQSSPTV
jgi:hypothetical protein